VSGPALNESDWPGSCHDGWSLIHRCSALMIQVVVAAKPATGTSECGQLADLALLSAATTSTRFIAAMCSLVRMLPLLGRGRGREVEGAGEGAEGFTTSAFYCF
jgi:hypothetical protein